MPKKSDSEKKHFFADHIMVLPLSNGLSILQCEFTLDPKKVIFGVDKQASVQSERHSIIADGRLLGGPGGRRSAFPTATDRNRTENADILRHNDRAGVSNLLSADLSRTGRALNHASSRRGTCVRSALHTRIRARCWVGRG